jgi:hypothetical protein
MAKRKGKQPSKPKGETRSELWNRYFGKKKKAVAGAADAPAAKVRASTAKYSAAKSKTVEQVVREAMPNKRIVTPSPRADGPRLAPDASTPDLGALHRKYFPSQVPDSVPIAPQATSSRVAGSTGIVLVAPAQATADAEQAQAKAVVVEDGKIVSKQG